MTIISCQNYQLLNRKDTVQHIHTTIGSVFSTIFNCLHDYVMWGKLRAYQVSSDSIYREAACSNNKGQCYKFITSLQRKISDRVRRKSFQKWATATMNHVCNMITGGVNILTGSVTLIRVQF